MCLCKLGEVDVLKLVDEDFQFLLGGVRLLLVLGSTRHVNIIILKSVHTKNEPEKKVLTSGKV